MEQQGKARHMYPGNNTPEGFYSYYDYILSQREADRIICIKGGPGVGKSTFMSKMAEELLAEGHDIDFMHCSSDSNSLDGIVLRDKQIAIVDGTRPHIVDPINPGAVDSIVHLGEFWDEEGIRRNRESVIGNNESIKETYSKAYNYLSAAGKMYDNVAEIYRSAIKQEELYKMFAEIIGRELAHKEISVDQGTQKKYFASGITPGGFENYLGTLLNDKKRIYVLRSTVGVSAEKLLQLFAESALYRGFDVEEYYCPMKPATKLEHLLVPQLEIAFVTSNRFHPLDANKLEGEVVVIDLLQTVKKEIVEKQTEILQDSESRMDDLLKRTIACLKSCKAKHDQLESYYIPNMDFAKVEALRVELTNKIR